MKKKLIKYLCIISIFVVSMSACYCATRQINTYAYPVVFTVGPAGSASVAGTYKVDTDKKTITFNNWTNYSVRTNSGYSISLQSRSYTNNSNGTVTINCVFNAMSVNTYQSSTYRLIQTVDYNDIANYHNIQR